MKKIEYHIEDFTERAYRDMLKLGKSKYVYSNFFDWADYETSLLIRHDVDYSIRQAMSLSLIESDLGISTTYFIYLQSEFYNALNNESAKIIRDIGRRGHTIGIHFDPNAYSHRSMSETSFIERLKNEVNILEDLSEKECKVFSVHNPTPEAMKMLENETGLGCINAYRADIMQYHKYCSDSNGYWRYDRLPSIVENGEHEHVYALIHPEWWIRQPMFPRDRIQLCADENRELAMKNYDKLLKNAGRRNVSENEKFKL